MVKFIEFLKIVVEPKSGPVEEKKAGNQNKNELGVFQVNQTLLTLFLL